MGSSKKTTTNQQQTTTAAPPSFTAPGLTDVAKQVTDAAAGLSALPTYQGPFIASPTDAQVQNVTNAYGNTAQTAGQMGTFLQNQLPGLTTAPTFATTLPTTSFTPSNPQDLTGVINASIAPVFQQLTERTLPGIKSDALASGAYSGDRAMTTLPELALRDASNNAENIAAQLGYQNYNASEDRRLSAFEADQSRLLESYNADTNRGLGVGNLMTERANSLPGLINTIMQMSSSQGDLARMANDYTTSVSQNHINDALAADQYSTSRPFQGLDIATQLLAALSGRYGTTDMTGKSTTTESTGGLGPILQGALGLGAGVLGFPGVSSALGLGAASGASMPAASKIFSNPAKLGS